MHLGHEGEHSHSHHNTDHTHPHEHTHSHEPDGGAHSDYEKTVALLSYMLDHNEHHAEELEEMAGKLQDLGMQKAAEEIFSGVACFKQGNDKLAEALELVKEHGQEG